MAQVIVTESSLENIAGAIRAKLGTQDTYKPSEMAGAIAQIHGDPVLEALNVNANGTYTPSSGKDGFSQAVVNVPNSYLAGDEGKVVSGGALVAQSSQGINANGTYNTTLKNEVVVNVPNSYSASDEGKVVDNGALVAQGSQSITQNGTYNTTLKKQVIVNVSGGGGGPTILSGTDAPSASVGSDGDIFIQYSNGGIRASQGQYIDTGYSGNSNSKYVIDFKLTEPQTSSWVCPFGGRPNPSGVNSASLLSLAIGDGNYSTTSLQWGSDPTINTGWPGASSLVGKAVHIELSAGLGKMSIDGTPQTDKTWTPTSVTNTTHIGLFAALANNSYQSWSYTKGMILYGFKIYENDVLVHDFVPAKDANDVACLYDEVAEEYKYVNSGTLTWADEDAIIVTYLKVNGTWQALIGSDIDDVNT